MKYIVTRENNDNSLMHYGVLGMRWRRRAFVRKSENVKFGKKILKTAQNQFGKMDDSDYDKLSSARKEFNKAKKNIPNQNSLEYKNAEKKYINARNEFDNKFNSTINNLYNADRVYKMAKEEAKTEFDNRLSEYKNLKKKYKYTNKEDRTEAKYNIKKAKSRLKNW